MLAPPPPPPHQPPDRERILGDTLARVFGGRLDAGGVLDLVVSSARRALAADRAACYVPGPDGALAVHATGGGDLSGPGRPVWHLLVARSDPILVAEDLAAVPGVPPGTASALRAGALIGVRLEHSAADALGALFVTYRRPRRLGQGDRAAARSLAGMAAIALADARLHDLRALGAVRALARAVDARDPDTRQHSERVAAVAAAIAREMGWEPGRRARLHEAALVHDVGKIGVPDRVLFKAGRLTGAERAEIVRHAVLGAEVVADVLTPEQVAWVRGHHERWDGTGYPDGLAGAAIPDGARVLALADAWDAMTCARGYREPLGPGQALAECVRCAGTQFWGEAVAALEGLMGPQATGSRTSKCPRPSNERT